MTGTSAGARPRIACALAREGYDLALTELRRAPRSKDTLAEPAIAKPQGGADRARSALAGRACEGASTARTNALGDIDLLVNNAGRALLKPVVDVTEAEWDDVIDTNLKGAFFLSQTVRPRTASRAKRPGASSAWPRRTA